jgi:SAM-dependent methyltransferase
MNGKERAAYYDVISDPAKRLAHEGHFLTRLLETAPGKRVLDMACGTGVQAEYLARQGATVTARDIDREMLDEARAKRAHERVTYEEGDMREAAGGPFDLAIVMGNSLSLLESADDAGRTFAAMGSMLAKRGVGFAHVVNYEALARGGPRQKVASRKTADGEIVIVKDMVPAKGAGALVAFSYFERRNGDWECWGNQSVLLDLRLGELTRAAEAAGLKVEGIYGDYDRSAFEEAKSPDLLLVLRKS